MVLMKIISIMHNVLSMGDDGYGFNYIADEILQNKYFNNLMEIM